VKSYKTGNSNQSHWHPLVAFNAPSRPNELEMKNLKVTINNLMEFADGIVQGANVTFTVRQAGKVLVEDSRQAKLPGLMKEIIK
jgi:hypothetical protein